MKENVLDVLMYIFENYYMDDEMDIGPDRESLHIELHEAGFPNTEINKAFDWLEGLAQQRETQLPVSPNQRSLRLYTDQECERLDAECRGFLMFLEQMNLLTAVSRERIIDRVMALDTPDVDLGDLKWIILMVLFNEPGQEAAYAWMEDFVFENLVGSVH